MGMKTTKEAQLFNLKDTGKGKEKFKINACSSINLALFVNQFFPILHEWKRKFNSAKPENVCFVDSPFPGNSFSINGHDMYHLTPSLLSSTDALNQSD